MFSCSLHTSFTMIILDRCPKLWKEWSNNSLPRSTEATDILTKHKTNLADLSCQRQQALFCLDSQGSYIGPLWSSCLLIWYICSCYWKTLQAYIVPLNGTLVSKNSSNITKTRLFKYIENLTSKNWKFSYKKIWYFSYFCSKAKHRLWVLVRTASSRRF